MKRHVLIYGLIGGILIAVLKWTEYRFLVIEHSLEIYGGLIAATFAVLGIWLGLKLTGRQERIVVKEVSIPAGEPFLPNEKKRENLGITPPRAGDPGADRPRHEQPRDRRETFRKREHGKDPFESRTRQIRCQATYAGSSVRQRTRSDPLNESLERMIFIRINQNHPKE